MLIEQRAPAAETESAPVFVAVELTGRSGSSGSARR
jgi:hypothetical protein